MHRLSPAPTPYIRVRYIPARLALSLVDSTPEALFTYLTLSPFRVESLFDLVRFEPADRRIYPSSSRRVRFRPLSKPLDKIVNRHTFSVKNAN